MSERSDSGSLTSSYYDSEADSASDTSSGTGYANPRGQETAANGTPNLALPDLADGRTQGGAAEPHSTQPGAAALFKSLSIASNGSGTARLPRLNLRSVSMPENSDSTLSISRYGPKPETDVVGATHRGPPPKRPYDVPPAVPEVPLRTELVIELVSPAFSLDAATIASAQEAAIDLSAAALQRASTGLGVDRSALRLFELREVQPGAQLAEDAERVAVAIVGSSFSLSALEETMQENKRLSTSAAQSASALEAMQKLVKDQNQALAKAQLLAQEAQAQARSLQDRCQSLEQDAASLRQQLHRSEELRQQGQRALGELKQEFDELTADIAEGGLDDSPAKPQAAAGPASRSDTAPAVDGQTQRVTTLLERLADETVLQRLEQFVGALSNQ